MESSKNEKNEKMYDLASTMNFVCAMRSSRLKWSIERKPDNERWAAVLVRLMGANGLMLPVPIHIVKGSDALLVAKANVKWIEEAISDYLQKNTISNEKNRIEKTHKTTAPKKLRDHISMIKCLLEDHLPGTIDECYIHLDIETRWPDNALTAKFYCFVAERDYGTKKRPDQQLWERSVTADEILKWNANHVASFVEDALSDIHQQMAEFIKRNVICSERLMEAITISSTRYVAQQIRKHLEAPLNESPVEFFIDWAESVIYFTWYNAVEPYEEHATSITQMELDFDQLNDVAETLAYELANEIRNANAVNKRESGND